MKKKKTYSEFLAESANRFMPEEDDIDVVEIDDEGGELEGLDDEEGIGDEEGLEGLDGEELEDEEVPQISIEDAIRAIQLVISGEAESAEDALDMVKDADGDYDDSAEGEGDELAPDEEDIVVVDDDIEECDKSVSEEEEVDGAEELEEDDDADVDGEELEEEVDDEEQYGESHSMFLKLSQRYL